MYGGETPSPSESFGPATSQSAAPFPVARSFDRNVMLHLWSSLVMRQLQLGGLNSFESVLAPAGCVFVAMVEDGHTVPSLTSR